MPDRGGEGEDPLGYSGADAGDGAAAVSFEVEVAFVGPVDGLDHLAQGFEALSAGSGLLAFAGRAQQLNAGIIEACLEVFAEVVLVADQDLPALHAVVRGSWGVGEDVFEHGTFVGFGLSLIHISEPTRLGMISYAVFC